MNKSIGILEAYGAIATYVAVDAALKASNVEILSREYVDGGLVTIVIEGDVSSVKAAIDAGVLEGEKLKCKIYGHVIASFSESASNVIEEKDKVKKKKKIISKELIKEKVEEEIVEKVANETVQKEETKDTKIELNIKDLENMKVVELRKIARDINVKGIERSKIKMANKEELLKLIKNHMKGEQNP